MLATFLVITAGKFIPSLWRRVVITTHHGTAQGVVTDWQHNFHYDPRTIDDYEVSYMFTGPDGSKYTGYATSFMQPPTKGQPIDVIFDLRNPQRNTPA